MMSKVMKLAHHYCAAYVAMAKTENKHRFAILTLRLLFYSRRLLRTTQQKRHVEYDAEACSFLREALRTGSACSLQLFKRVGTSVMTADLHMSLKLSIPKSFLTSPAIPQRHCQSISVLEFSAIRYLIQEDTQCVPSRDLC